jgi:hypothetical protein
MCHHSLPSIITPVSYTNKIEERRGKKRQEERSGRGEEEARREETKRRGRGAEWKEGKGRGEENPLCFLYYKSISPCWVFLLYK